MTWSQLLALLTSAGFGVISAIAPLLNAEAYVLAAQMSGLADAIQVAVAIGVGQSIGKLVLFLGVRRGKQAGFVRRHRTKPYEELGRFRRWLRRVIDKLLALVGDERWGLPIVLLAAVLGFPPLYAVALIAGATRMRAVSFWVVVLLGRIARFVLLVLGVGHGLDLLP